MSEVIINIIILLVIILSVLKRINEVNKKSSELGNEKPRQSWGDLLEDGQLGKRIQDVFTEGVPADMKRPVSVDQTVRGDNGTFEPAPVSLPPEENLHPAADFSRGADYDMSAEADFDRLQTEKRELEMKLWLRKPETVTKSKVTVAVPQYLQSVGNLSFSRNNIVAGIVMSEILGPPVAMRQREGPW